MIKIMPIGDSITYGVINGSNTNSGGYRTDLWNSLTANGQAVDFVGSLSTGPSSIDDDHEGRRGWRIDEIASSISGWLSMQQPDVVLLMIGTNDILQDYQLSTAPARLSNLIDQIVAQVAGVKVLVASIPPSGRSDSDQQQSIDFNSKIPGIVSEKVNQGKAVYFIDVFSRLSVSDLADQVHPTASGYSKIADAWYDALQPVLGDVGETGGGASLRLETEAMNLSGYRVETGIGAASGSELITLYNTGNSQGMATSSFTGATGTYDVFITYFDESDGAAQLSLQIGNDQSSWTLNQQLGDGGVSNKNKVVRKVFSSVELVNGDGITISGVANAAEWARVDMLEFVPLSNSPAPAPAPAPIPAPAPAPAPAPTPVSSAPVRFEAEDMALTNYVIETGQSAASNHALISLYNSGNSQGMATAQFSGLTGTYDVRVGYFDESDGLTAASLQVGGHMASWQFNQNLREGGVSSKNRVVRTLLDHVAIAHGDAITLTGSVNKTEFARVDFIEFVAVDISLG